MTLESKLRALVAGMRYAADKCDEYATSDGGAPPWTSPRYAELARAIAYRSDANAVEAILNEHNEARDAR
jgi:hypothetical protein